MQIDNYLPLQSTSNHNPVLFDVIFNEDRILAHAWPWQNINNNGMVRPK